MNRIVAMKHLKLMLKTLIVSLASVLAPACIQVNASEGDDESEIITIYVGSELVDCVGVAPQNCMQVRQSPDEPYTLFYDQIVGFEYDEGYEYELRVNITKVENPPADASHLQYRLVEVVSKVPV